MHQDNKRVYPNEFLGSKGKIVGWAPQQKVLNHPGISCFVIGTEQGGQSPKWQLWEAGCEQGWGIEHGSWHDEGGGVPQGNGGGIEVLPQQHVTSVNIVSRQGGQWPLWHKDSHACCPHLKFLTIHSLIFIFLSLLSVIIMNFYIF